MFRPWQALIVLIMSPIPILGQLPNNTATAINPEPVVLATNPSDFANTTGIWGEYSPRIMLRHSEGRGVGYERGFTELNGWVPLANPMTDGLLFLDTQLLADNEGFLGVNTGLGLRYEWEPLASAIGLHLNYDNRHTGINTFHQVSFGVEYLSNWINIRGNGYIPIGDEEQGTGQFVFRNHFLLRELETALYGGDFEVEVPLAVRRENRLAAHAGGYHFRHDGAREIWGWKAGVRAEATENVALDLAVSNDAVFDTRVVAGFALHYGGSRRAQDDEIGLGLAGDRMAAPVQRLRNLVVSREARELARDPVTGHPLFFLHVNQGGNSDGSFEDPYGTLAEAIADPRFAAGDVIVYDRTSGVFRGDIVTGPRTQLLSASFLQFVDTQFGSVLLPFSGAGNPRPQIIGSVTLKGSSVISAFAVHGVNLNLVPNGESEIGPTNINQDIFAAIRIHGDGKFRVDNVLVTSQERNAVGIEVTTRGQDVADVLIRNNEIRLLPNSGSGISVEALNNSFLNLVIRDNVIVNGGAENSGILAIAFNRSRICFDASGNAITSNGSAFTLINDNSPNSVFQVVDLANLSANNFGATADLVDVTNK